MSINQTFEKLQQLRLHGISKALEEQLNTPDIKELSFEERLGLLINRESIDRENRRLSRRLQQAKLKQNANLEDINYRSVRGLERSVMLSLADCEWVRRHQNIIITGPTGVGKTYLACALAQKACREGFSASYQRLSRLFQELGSSRADGQYTKLLEKIAKTEVLVLDDFGIAVLTETQRRDFLEVVEDRYNARSTIITTQIPITKWHEVIGDPTLADAILDRLVHNAHKIQMKGGSMRKKTNESIAKVTT
jgi:DNA replication protein DnaC